ncbi:hypothetical protein IC229_32070 [Spirosoma sp. BT702]|uniref:Uncharacterized protein n=1 Tax=Spirosoma profusum TaxID=2771354 RepID=A0A927AVR7_9BACT|nr:hypothetical protein [Spirosoma profusum]
MTITHDDIVTTVEKFIHKSSPEDRFSSFDYCYNYFRLTRPYDLTSDSEMSCLTLGFYLASWGMLRGSSFLLGKSAKYFQPTIEYIASLDRSVWTIDVDTYTDENIQKIITIYSGIKGTLIQNRQSDLTLITKVLLGVFGFMPAFDQHFCNTFRTIFRKENAGFRRINEKSLTLIKMFYAQYQSTIDELANSTFTTDFKSGLKTDINYPKAKIIDMYGFSARN